MRLKDAVRSVIASLTATADSRLQKISRLLFSSQAADYSYRSGVKLPAPAEAIPAQWEVPKTTTVLEKCEGDAKD